MAQKIQTLFIDDLDGGEAEGTVSFALDGAHYEIDLSEAHARELRATLGRYAGAGRKVTGTTPAGPPPGQGRRGRAQHHGDTRLGESQRLRGQGPRPDPGRRGRRVPGGHRPVDRWPPRPPPGGETR